MYHRLLFLAHGSLIKNKTKTAVINIREFLHLYKLDVSYAIQHTFSKVILIKKMTRLHDQILQQEQKTKNVNICSETVALLAVAFCIHYC